MIDNERIALRPVPEGWEPDEHSPAPEWAQRRAVQLSETATYAYTLGSQVEQLFIALELAHLGDVLDARSRAIQKEWSY